MLVRFSHEHQSHEVLLRVSEPARSREEIDKSIARQLWILFGDVRGIRAEIDLVAKVLCANAIASVHQARAADESELIDRLDARFKAQLSPDLPDRTDLIRFHIWLCPPSGSIEVLAKTVAMRKITSAGDAAAPFIPELCGLGPGGNPSDV